MNNSRENTALFSKDSAAGTISLSIVVPAFNEGENVSAIIKEIIDTMTCNDWCGMYEIIIVDDGSVDNTGSIAEAIARNNTFIRVFHHSQNQGLGAALKTGFLHAQGEAVTFISADGEIGIDQALNLYRDMGGADLMVSKRIRSMGAHREILTKGFNVLTRFIVGYNITGMSGIFVIRNSILKTLSMRSTTGLLNLEIIMQCKKRGYTVKSGTMQTRPRLSGKSKVTNMSTVVKNIIEMIKLRLAIINDGIE